MRAGHSRNINEAKHRIKLLRPGMLPIHSESRRGGRKIWEFGKAKTDEMLAENIIAPAKTERADPVMLFSPQKNDTL